ncbi:MAG: hypothetical protein WAX48_20300 [Desulfosalsimonadaceae bacterium]
MAGKPKNSFKNVGLASFGLLLGFRGGIDHLRQSSLSVIRSIRDKKSVYPARYLTQLPNEQTKSEWQECDALTAQLDYTVAHPNY